MKEEPRRYFKWARILTHITFPIYSSCSALSLFLLAIIFIQLSNPQGEGTRGTTRSSGSSIQSIKVEEFDEEAEVQARIWN